MNDPDDDDVMGTELIRVSRAAKNRFEQIKAQMRADLRRRVYATEVLEKLMADQWGDKP